MVIEEIETKCFHCGDDCVTNDLILSEKHFCCSGCLNVYQLLNNVALENYYCLNEAPGQKVKAIPKEKYAYLEEESVIQKLLLFRNSNQAQVLFFLPQMHCSSCLWLLEHLPEVDDKIIYTQVNFNDKTIKITFKINELSLRQLTELLAYIGYEPCIDINDDSKSENKYSSKRAYLKLGITGFCFANIMLIAFPEYLGLDPKTQPSLALFFKYANVLLSLPVVFYGAQEFFINAWYSFRQRFLNIDAPIALAIAVTFLRSLYEVFSNTGAGYFDSMSGIVFFMLLGRTLQNRSYTTLRFNRDYKSYFPIAVTRITPNGKTLTKLDAIAENEVLLIHHQEVIPTDCLLSKGNANIDYSFISGEDKPEIIEKGGLVYAGGKNIGDVIEVLTVKPFSQNSFTQLWNSSNFQKKNNDKESKVTIISKYFSIIVLAISIISFIVWQFLNPSISWKAATAVLIVACPCALLLTASFTNGYLLEKFANNGFFLKNAQVIEGLTKINHIAFDKTGTLTDDNKVTVEVLEDALLGDELEVVLNALSQSLHPLSVAIVQHYKYQLNVTNALPIKELAGLGISVWEKDRHFKIGNKLFTTNLINEDNDETRVYVTIDEKLKAIFRFNIALRVGVDKLLRDLSLKYSLSLISGDNAASRSQLSPYFNLKNGLHYQMKPQDKLEHIKHLQNDNLKVMMIGDGLNDAGALQQSDVGLAIVKSAFSFSPSSDVIMEGNMLDQLPVYLKWALKGQHLINFGFTYSVIFNIIGLVFAVTGNLSPLVAAILMPMSSLGIILIAYLGVKNITKKSKLSL